MNRTVIFIPLTIEYLYKGNRHLYKPTYGGGVSGTTVGDGFYNRGSVVTVAKPTARDITQGGLSNLIK